MWKHTSHKNIVPFYGATFDPRQLVFDWMEHGDLVDFLEACPNANRLGLVGTLRATYVGLQSAQPSPATGCC